MRVLPAPATSHPGVYLKNVGHKTPQHGPTGKSACTRLSVEELLKTAKKDRTFSRRGGDRLGLPCAGPRAGVGKGPVIPAHSQGVIAKGESLTSHWAPGRGRVTGVRVLYVRKAKAAGRPKASTKAPPGSRRGPRNPRSSGYFVVQTWPGDRVVSAIFSVPAHFDDPHLISPRPSHGVCG